MIGIVDYGLGNVASVLGAVEYLGHSGKITADPAHLMRARKLILPGVGAFGDGMRNLAARGLVDVLNELVLERGTPILGICLGCQLMASESQEFGRHLGFGWISGRVVPLDDQEGRLRVPHVGWNDTMLAHHGDILFERIEERSLFYYVHSYRMEIEDRRDVAAECDYGGRFVAAISRQRIYGTQFHPEKSQKAGLQLLRNFLERG